MGHGLYEMGTGFVTILRKPSMTLPAPTELHTQTV